MITRVSPSTCFVVAVFAAKRVFESGNAVNA
jgi:hypothetical protein